MLVPASHWSSRRAGDFHQKLPTSGKALHQALVEQHRNYHAAIKDFHDECQKNEMLLARVEEAG